MPIFIKCLEGLRKTTEKICPFFYQRLLKRRFLVKYLVAGIFTGTMDLFSLFILHGVLKINVVAATTLAFVLSLGISFIFNASGLLIMRDRKRFTVRPAYILRQFLLT